MSRVDPFSLGARILFRCGDWRGAVAVTEYEIDVVHLQVACSSDVKL